MTGLLRPTLLTTLAGALLLGLFALSQPYRHEAAWRVPPQHQRFVERALGGAARVFGVTREDYRRETRPRVQERGRETCVTLATRWSHAGGSYIACYDTRDGSIVSETVLGWPLAGTRLRDRLAEWVW